VPRIATLPLADQPLGVLAPDDQPQATTAPLASRPIGTTGSHVPHQSPDQARATSMPDTAWPISRLPPGSFPGSRFCPVSMSSCLPFDTSSVDRLRSPSWPIPAALTGATFPTTLTTTALDRSSSGWFATSPLQGGRGGTPAPSAGPSISDAAPHQLTDLLHRLSFAFRVRTIRGRQVLDAGPDRAEAARRPRHPHLLRGRPHRLPRGDRGDLPQDDRPNMRSPLCRPAGYADPGRGLRRWWADRAGWGRHNQSASRKARSVSGGR
jgi:hypothetical protein